MAEKNILVNDEEKVLEVKPLLFETEMKQYEEIISTKSSAENANLFTSKSKNKRKKEEQRIGQVTTAIQAADNSLLRISDQSILGGFPSKSEEVSSAMKDRILVLSLHKKTDNNDLEMDAVINEDNYYDSNEEIAPSFVGETSSITSSVIDYSTDFNPFEDSEGQLGEGVVWDRRSVEELAQLYKATPVIYLPSYGTDANDYNGGACQEDFEPPVWTDGDKQRHSTIAQAISDWLHMLTAFNYL